MSHISATARFCGKPFNYNVNRKKKIAHQPQNEIYWQSTRIDKLSKAALGQTVFGCRDHAAKTTDFPEEIMHGHGSYFYSAAMVN